jgi:hypothetical protein
LYDERPTFDSTAAAQLRKEEGPGDAPGPFRGGAVV